MSKAEVSPPVEDGGESVVRSAVEWLTASPWHVAMVVGVVVVLVALRLFAAVVSARMRWRLERPPAARGSRPRPREREHW